MTSLKTQLIMLFLIIGLIPLLIIGFISLNTNKIELEKEVAAHLKNTVHSRTIQINDFLDEHKEFIEILSKDPRYLKLLTKPIDLNKEMTEYYSQILKNQLKKDVYELFIINKQGKIVASTNASNVGLDKSKDAYFINGLKKTYLKDAYFSKSTGKNSIAVSTPIKNPETNETIGVIVARIETTKLNEITLDRTGLGETGEIYLLNKEGYMITPSRFEENTFLKEKVETKNALNCLNHNKEFSNEHNTKSREEELIHSTNYLNEPVLGLHEHVPELNWCLLTEITEAEAMSGIKEAEFKIILMTLLFAILLIIIALIYSGYVLKPINKLTETVNEITKGKLEIQLKKSNILEIQKLTDSLNRILASMKLAVLKTGLTKQDIGLGEAIKAKEEAEKNFQRIFQTSHDVIINIDLKGKILALNEAFTKHTGYDYKELIGKNIKDIKALPITSLLLILKDIAMFLAGKETKPYEIEFKKKNGGIGYAEISPTKIIKDGKLVGIQSIIRDVTQRVEARKTLERRDKILSALSFISKKLLNSFSIEKNFLGILSPIGDAAKVSRVYIFKNFYKSNNISTKQIAEWASKGIPSELQNTKLQYVDYKKDGFKRWLNFLSKKEPVYGLIKHFPKSEQKLLLPQKIKSIAVVPIFVKNTFWGFIGFDDCVKERKWTLTELDALKAIANLIGNAIERNEAEKELKESEKRFKDISYSTADIIWETNKEGKYTFVSGKVKEILGYDSNELIGKTPFELIIESEREKIKKKFEEVVKEKKPIIDLKNWNKHKNGKKVLLLTNGIPIINKKGELIGYRGVDKDITEKNKIEKELKEKEEKYKDLIENANELIQSVDEEGNFLFVNKKWKETLGYTEKDLEKINLWNILKENQIAKCRDIFNKILKGEKINHVETVFIAKNGKKVFVEGTASGLFKNNKFVSTRGVFKNVTGKKKQKELTELFEKGFYGSPNSRVLVDYKNNEPHILKINSKFTEYYGYTIKEVEGKNPRAIQSGKYDKKFYEKMWKDLLNPKIGFWKNEITNKKKNGEFIEVILSINTIFNENGKAEYFIADHIDITKQKQIERKLKKINNKNKALLKALPDMMFILTKNGDFKEFWADNEENLAIPSNQIVGKNIKDTNLTREQVEKVLEIIKNVLKTSETQSVEYSLETKTKKPGFYEAKIAKLNENEVVAIVHDLTKRKKIEKELKESEKKLKAVFDNSNDGIVLVDKTGKILKINKRITDVSGYTEEELIGKRFALMKFIKPKFLAIMLKDFNEILKGNKNVPPKEIEITMKNGETKIIEILGSPMIEDNKITGMVATLRDVTNIKRIQK